MKLRNFNLYICYYIIFTQMFLSIDVLKIILFIILLIQNIICLKNFFQLNKKQGVLYFILFIYLILGSLKSGDFLNVIYNFIIFFTIGEIVLNKFSVNQKYKLNKFYTIILNLNFLVLLIQIILKKIFDINILFFWQSKDLIRPMGFFSEPSHFAFYLIGIIFLFNKLNFFQILYYILILLLLKSFVGYIIIIIIILKYIILKINLKKLITILLGIFIILITIEYLEILDVERYEKIRERKDISFVIRVLKGPRVYKILTLKEKILGIGINNEIKNIEYTEKTNFEKSNGYLKSYNYYSGIFLELIEFGIIGFFLINYLYYIKFKNKIIFIFFEIIRLGISLNFRSMTLYFVLVMLYISKNEKKINIERIDYR